MHVFLLPKIIDDYLTKDDDKHLKIWFKKNKSIFKSGKVICYISTSKTAMRIESCDIQHTLAQDKIDIYKELYIVRMDNLWHILPWKS
jgi:hypothetical protein